MHGMGRDAMGCAGMGWGRTAALGGLSGMKERGSWRVQEPGVWNPELSLGGAPRVGPGGTRLLSPGGGRGCCPRGCSAAAALCFAFSLAFSPQSDGVFPC